MNKKKALQPNIINYLNELKEKENLVKTESYLNWIYNFTKKHKSWSMEDFLYKKMDKVDDNNISLLSDFYNYIETMAKSQNIIGKPIKDSMFESREYHFKLKKEYFSIVLIIGQGSFLKIKLTSFDEHIDYVLLDEELDEKTLKERELVEYIIINKDLIDKISPSKFSVHIGHACTIVALKQRENPNFDLWYQNGTIQKKIILKASQAKLESLEKDFYSVRDLGLSEVEPNTLIAVSLGVMSRKEAKPYIKGFQLW